MMPVFGNILTNTIKSKMKQKIILLCLCQGRKAECGRGEAYAKLVKFFHLFLLLP